MKICVAQITTDPGRIAENTQKIVKNLRAAKDKGAELVVFPELTVPGYGVMDLCYNQAFIQENLQALDEIIHSTVGLTAVVGFIRKDRLKTRPGGRPALYNSAAVFKDGRLLGFQDKTLLPDYDIFFEDRYFLPAEDYKVFEIGNGMKLGVQICEDLWDELYPAPVTDKLVEKGADIIVNISASPFHVGKVPERMKLIDRVYKKFVGTFVYANLVGSFDGYEGEVVFDGRSMIYYAGTPVAFGKAFTEDLLEGPAPAGPCSIPTFDPTEELYSALVLGIKDFFRRQGFARAYIGLSGGIDSSVVAAFAVAALGEKNVIGVTMPSHITSAETKSDAVQLAKNLGIECRERPIGPEYEAWLGEFKRANRKDPAPMTKQNKQARIRGTIMMECVNEDIKGLVLTTGNKTELATGYCTLYGDMCGALAVLGDVSKERVYSLASFINQRAGKEIVPISVMRRVPTAELEVGQEDRMGLPADYPVLSPLVEEIVESGESVEVLAAKYPREVVEKTNRLVHINEFKRRQAPPGIRVTRRAFGIGRRLPMGHGYAR